MVRESVRNIKGIASVFVLATACFLFGGNSEKTFAAEVGLKLEASDDTGKFTEITDSTKLDGFKYDSNTNTIELNNYDSTKTGFAYFRYTSVSSSAIIPTLNVKISGKNVLSGKKNAGVNSAGIIMITGNGNLDISDVDGDTIPIRADELTIDGPTINFSGNSGVGKIPISAYKGVTIKSANINFEKVIDAINGGRLLEIIDSEINITQYQEPYEESTRNYMLNGDVVNISNSVVNFEVNRAYNYNGIIAYGTISINDSKLDIKAIPNVNTKPSDDVIYPTVLYASYIQMNNVDIHIEIVEYERGEYRKLGSARLIGANTSYTLNNINVVVTGDKEVVDLLEDFKEISLGSYDVVRVVFAVYDEITVSDVVVKKLESTDVSKLDIELKNNSEVNYTGEPVKPELDLNGLIEGKDVEITYENNDRLGLAYIVVKGVGMFNGTKKIPFIITGKQAIDGPKVGTKITDGKFIYTIKKQAQRVIECKAVDGKPVFTESNELNPGSVAVTKLKKKSLKKVNINSEVVIDGFKYQITEIGKKAFKNNKKIKQVNIKSEYLTKIGNYAFANCKKLKKVKINAKALKKIGKKAFYKKGKKAKKVVVYIKKYGKKNWKKVFKKAKCKNYKLKVK